MTSEVVAWLLGLPDDDFGFVAYHIDLLQELGPHLGEPHVRALVGPLRVLRLRLGAGDFGLTHCVAGRSRIVLLTVLREDQSTEEADVERALVTLERCVRAGNLPAQEEARDRATA